jgi:hypothetical protein
MSTDFRAELHRLVEAIKNWDFDTGSLEQDWSALDRACAALAQQPVSQPYKLPQPEPVAPTDEDINDWHSQCADLTRRGAADHYWAFELQGDELAGIVRAALVRWGTPAIQPVPVSERLPGDDECRSNPRTGTGHWCWGFIQHDPYSFAGRWRMMKSEWLTDEADFWLPHWALPVPTPTP